MAERKTRPREHVIASMSVHHVGFIISKVGYAFDIPNNDYGVDGKITTFKANTEIESEYINVQLKATDNIKFLNNGMLSFVLDMRDINGWMENFFPVILIVFDVKAERGYYLIVQEYFNAKPMTDKEREQDSLTVHIDPNAIVNEDAVRLWRDVKEQYKEALR